MQLLQLGLQGFEVSDGPLQVLGGRTEELELPQVAADVVQTHVGETAPKRSGNGSPKRKKKKNHYPKSTSKYRIFWTIRRDHFI